MVSFVLDHLSLYVIGKEKDFNKAFTDVKAGDWFYGDVQYVYEKGLMKGTGAASFSPGIKTTRGMIVTILHYLEGSPKPEGVNTFADVAEGKWYSDAGIWAADKKIVAGYGYGTFGPEDSVTREQVALILMNYAKFKGYDVSAKTELKNFSDSDNISVWARDAVSWANAAGLMKGMGNGVFAPQGAATRAQLAAIMHQFVEAFK